MLTRSEWESGRGGYPRFMGFMRPTSEWLVPIGISGRTRHLVIQNVIVIELFNVYYYLVVALFCV